METPRTDKAAYVANFGGIVVVDADFAWENLHYLETYDVLKEITEDWVTGTGD